MYRRFYTPRRNLTIGSSVKLEDTDNNHIRKVLRLSKGDKIIIFNEEKEYLAELKYVTKNFVTAIIQELLNKNLKTSRLTKITLFLSLFKKLDDTLRILNELGLDDIYIVESEYSSVKLNYVLNKKERWRKILISSSKQCGRIGYLNIVDLIKFEDIPNILNLKNFDKIFFLTNKIEKYQEKNNNYRKNIQINFDDLVNKNIAYFVGPEGGFSHSEHLTAKSLNFEFISPFENIMRTENAATSFLSILKYFLK